MTQRSWQMIGLVAVLVLLGGCATSPPNNPDNLCAIFREKDDWYHDARQAQKRWGSSIPVSMAIMYQESRFKADAQPPFRWFLIIPLGRASDAYGYAQAKDDTWETYQRATGRHGADRDDFADAMDFIGWYNHTSVRRNYIKPDDTYYLYLAYHEGHGGFTRRSFNNKQWLKDVARKVSARAGRYRGQLASCEAELQRSRGFFNWLF